MPIFLSMVTCGYAMGSYNALVYGVERCVRRMRLFSVYSLYIMKKTRWVKKGAKKSKGYRKTGRTRKRNGLHVSVHNAGPGAYTLRKLSYKYPFPSEFTTLLETQIEGSCATASTNVAGVSNLMTFSANTIISPFNATLSAYTGVAKMTATAPGFASTISPEYAIGDSPAYSADLARLYQQYIVLASQVSVQFHFQGGNDAYEVVVAPGYNTLITNTNMLKNMKEYKNSKYTVMNLFQEGFRNRLTSKWIRTADIAGSPHLTDSEWEAKTGTTLTISQPTTQYAWIIVGKDQLGAVNLSAPINFRVILRQKVKFSDPLGSVFIPI